MGQTFKFMLTATMCLDTAFCLRTETPLVSKPVVEDEQTTCPSADVIQVLTIRAFNMVSEAVNAFETMTIESTSSTDAGDQWSSNGTTEGKLNKKGVKPNVSREFEFPLVMELQVDSHGRAEGSMKPLNSHLE